MATTDPTPVVRINDKEFRDAQGDPLLREFLHNADEALAKLEREDRSVEWTPEDGDPA